MTLTNQVEPNILPGIAHAQSDSLYQQVASIEKILCPHCQRTATNGIKCKGICVADHDY